jgi:deoxyribodipyrimidine photo-lyase
LLRQGRPKDVLSRLCEETGAAAIFAEDDVSPYARRRDRAVASALPLRRLPGLAVRAPGSVMKADGDPYVVYSPFARTWREAPLPRPEETLSAPDCLNTPHNLSGDALPQPDNDQLLSRFPAGEQEARRRLQTFLDQNTAQYGADGDRLDQDNTSRLSPYLRLGMISPRTVAAAIAERRDHANVTSQQKKGLTRWLDELIWRDFFIHILHHFPNARRQSFRPKYRALSWRNDRPQFDAWRHGQTGYPVVDAAMRQLAQTGWIANRARMIVASFLVKDLLIDWRWGERWFMQQLVDGDPALNNGNWQWVAGTGTDAAPYFRIFNPVTQGQKHDPEGTYIRRWVPELANVDGSHIHRPWRMSEAEQQAAGCRIGRDYPAPIVNHQEARKQTLAAYKSL